MLLYQTYEALFFCVKYLQSKIMLEVIFFETTKIALHRTIGKCNFTDNLVSKGLQPWPAPAFPHSHPSGISNYFLHGGGMDIFWKHILNTLE